MQVHNSINHTRHWERKMKDKRIQELKDMLDRGTIQKRHILEMLNELESNNQVMSVNNPALNGGA
jgi:hypothetical protein